MRLAWFALASHAGARELEAEPQAHPTRQHHNNGKKRRAKDKTGRRQSQPDDPNPFRRARARLIMLFGVAVPRHS